ncbi:MAG: hypothetical protein EVA91_05815 [SAR116 cluster bacterium]|nr:MAG: hypothetical protein EVA91_05815 [SAR116 cluster bacterium]|tara:strand:+ start:55 stop:243 length:189 start_codon:yes stop_codon:yes gene_type:complete
MLLRRIIFGALMQAARNPTVQKKAGEAAGKALEAAKPGLLRASRRAGELTRQAKDKVTSPDK